ncbi:MAG: DUF4127 family protein, partial [Vulcanimicrobiaceae bacterium]
MAVVRQGFRRVTVTLASLGIAAVTFGAPPFARAAPAGRTVPTVVLVPLDDRPVTYRLPLMLGEIAGQRVIAPPHDELGNYLRPGDPQAILPWLFSPQTADASAFVVSSDMIAYGGLVASRLPGLPAGIAYARLSQLARLRTARPAAFIDLFGTIMRLAPTGVPAGGPTRDFFAAGERASLIADYANLPDPPVTPQERAQAEALRAKIGAPVLAAYLDARRRDREVDAWALQLAGEGEFDRIVLGQDDAGPTGLHLRDIAALERTAAAWDLGARASIEPGADELGMLGVAAAFARNVGWRPSVAVDYSRADGGGYEDPLEYVPVASTIARMIATAGAHVQSGPADVELFVKVPQTSDADEAAYEDRIAAAVAAGESVAVADLSFLEGNAGPAQRELTEALIARGIAGRIDAFASWNTDANTVGTALATALAVGAGKRAGTYDAQAHAEFLLDRYADDYAFHQFVRPQLNDDLRSRGIDTEVLFGPTILEAADENRSLLWP